MVLGIFIYWQYSTLNEFHNTEVDNFFTQSNQIIKILIAKEKSEIKDILLSNVKTYENKKDSDLINLNNIDFIFSTKYNKLLKVDGYNLSVDVHKLAMKLKDKKNLKTIERVEVNGEYFYLVVHKEKIINPILGKVVGELWGATILNENVNMLNEFKKDIGIDEFAIIGIDNSIIASTLDQNKMNSLLLENTKDNIFLSKNKEFMIGKKVLLNDSKIHLNTLFVINNTKYNNIFNKLTFKTSWAIIILIVMGILLYLFIRIKFINKLQELNSFIQNSLKNNDVIYQSSSIVELDTIATEFEHLFFEFKLYQENLEETVKKKTNENIKQLEILQQQSKMAQMGEMIGAIAHQWRQPLNIISTGIQNLKYDFKDGNLNDEKFVKDFINENKKTVKFMSKTIDDFRSFFRTDKVKVDFKVLETICSVIDMQSSQLKTHKIQLNISGEEFIYNGLQSEFQQVILNIINNAKDALVENKIEEPLIKVIIKENQITIEDNANGIPKNILNRVFEPYFTTKEQGKGTGIGLYISKMIIEDNMQSILEVVNTTIGAKFIITLK